MAHSITIIDAIIHERNTFFNAYFVIFFKSVFLRKMTVFLGKIRAFHPEKRRPGWGAPFSVSAAAAVIALAAAAAVVAAPQSIAAAVAEQNDQQDDPAQVAATEIIIAHNKYLQDFFTAEPLIPCYSTGRKMCSR